MTPDHIGSLIGRFYDGLLGTCALAEPLDLLKRHLSASDVRLRIEPVGAASEAFESDGAHVAEADALLADGARCSLIAIRRRSASAFTGEDRALCRILIRHIERALSMCRRLEAAEVERGVYARVMNRLMVGAAILDGRGHLLRMTPMIEDVLATADGLRLTGERLHAQSAIEDRRLQNAIRAALGGIGDERSQREAISVSRPSGARALGLVVMSLVRDPRSVGTAPAVAILVRDSERDAELAHDAIRELFGLTPAEAELARRLAHGASLADAASALGIRHNTARAHLRSIFSKSGVTRQSELVRLLLNSVAALGPEDSAGPDRAVRVRAA